MKWAALRLACGFLGLAGIGQAGDLLVCREAGHVFAAGEPVQFFAPPGVAAVQMRWEVADWQGKKVLSGEQKIAPAGALSLSGLPLGYFLLHATAAAGDTEQTLAFARVPEPVPDRESPFALDAAPSWLAGAGFGGNTLQPAAHYAEAATLARLAGAAQVRDRLRWGDISPQPGSYQWSTYEKSASLLAAAGLPIVSLFHDAPSNARGPRLSLPDDLLRLYDFSRAAAAHFGSRVPDWEFWNEPDGSYCQDPAWEFAEAQKAATLGYKAGNPQARVLQGANAVHPTSRFTELLFENGIGSYLDRFNFHLYAKVESFPTLFAAKRELLAQAGVPQLPMWITELGLLGEGPGAAPSLVPGKKLVEHDPAQELTQAEYLTKALVTAHALGAARSFYFVLPPYNEQASSKVWGLFRWDWSVKPAYAAFATLTAQTSGRRLRGSVKLGPGVTAYLFESRRQPGAQTVVFWGKAGSAVAWPQPPAAGSDLVGQPLPVAELAQAERFPRYARGSFGLRPQVELAAPAPLPPVNPPPVVLGLAWPDRQAIVNRVAVDLPAGSEVRAIVRVHNFSAQARTISLQASGENLVLGALPKTLEIPALTRRELPLTVRRRTPGGATALKITGTDAGRTLAPVLVPLRSPDDDLAGFPQRPLPIADASRWLANGTGPVTITAAAAEGTITFRLRSKAVSDHWIYPKFRLKLPAETLAGTVGVSFSLRATSPPPPSAVLARKAFLIAYGDGGLRSEFPIAVQPDWQRVVLLWASDAPGGFDPAAVRVFSIGANPTTADFSYAVRDFRILKAP